MIEGVTPASPGWCSAECDLPSSTPAVQSGAEVFYNVPGKGGALIPAGSYTVFYSAELGRKIGYTPYTIQGEYIAKPDGELFVDVHAGESGCEIKAVSTINGVFQAFVDVGIMSP